MTIRRSTQSFFCINLPLHKVFSSSFITHTSVIKFALHFTFSIFFPKLYIYSPHPNIVTLRSMLCILPLCSGACSMMRYYAGSGWAAGAMGGVLSPRHSG
jgi:hypothetical protein